ncbi:MAG: aldo/keto reductase [Prochlorococcus sp. SP3034]|nr:aldo/keto reductase [Prochlorococcus sp. SP3034]|tara:strand:+ start:1139 stop:2338 length:1200 start_codon:yes stop_codon:yes gene_type:complete
MALPYRRFGRTNINMPILSLGGMRFQKSWDQIDFKDISKEEQNKVNKILNLAKQYGLNHIETARHYGSSELQIGTAISENKKRFKIIQTKVPPNSNTDIFEEELRLSFENLGVKKIDLLAIHGINTSDHLNQAIRTGGCVDVLRKWQKEKLISHIGFSTHGNLSIIEQAISSNKFDFVNLHWYFINQINYRAIHLAKKYDLGVFIISPTDKGGHLYSPSEKFSRICKPIHPIIFNDLFCLQNKNVHTISVGVSEETDFDLHLEAVSLLPKVDEYVPQIIDKFTSESIKCMGLEWHNYWHEYLPKWEETPGNINIPVLIWLSNLIEAWDMEDFARSRYQLLGNGSHWFPGNNANSLDISVNEIELLHLLNNHINPERVIQKLRTLKEKFGKKQITRLTVI